MTSKKIISRKITSKITASIIGTNPKSQMDQKLWAINWFDLKRPWAYELYGKLAIGHLKKINALPVFKGKLSLIILDNERLKRDMLLIAQYPAAISFLEMISSKLFQLKSLLRNSSVKYFQFGFMDLLVQKEDMKSTLNNLSKSKLKYMVHVCEGGKKDDLELLLKQIESKDVFPFFIGQKNAILGLQKGNRRLKTLDFILSHVLVFGGLDEEALEELTTSAPYQAFVNQNTTNFIGIYDRMI